MRLLFGGYLSRNAIGDEIWGNRNRLQFLSNRNRLNDQKWNAIVIEYIANLIVIDGYVRD